MENNGLRPVNRFITDHDSNKQAVFSSHIPDKVEWEQLESGDGARFGLSYVTDEFPVDMNNDADIKTYQGFRQKPPGIMMPGGSVLRYVDMPPGALSPMHRTVSLDYGVVLEGEVELLLDSGESRIMKRGDVAVQRGTNHAWKNNSSTEWSRMLYVLQEGKPITINGEKLGEDYGEMDGEVPSSFK